MITFKLNELQLGEFWHDEAPDQRGRGGFPLVGVEGTESIGMVYFELEPGDSLGLHTDSPDEFVVVLSGTAFATVGDEQGEIGAGSVAFIPSMVPHGFENVGDDMLKVIGIFPTSDVVSTFEYVLQPFGTRVLEFKAMAPAPTTI